MATTRGTSASDFLPILLIAAAMVGAAVAIGIYSKRLKGGAAELQQANPGWVVKSPDYSPVFADDGTPAGEVRLRGDDVGPYRIERVDCAEVRAAFPAWFKLPDAPVGNCVRLYDLSPPTLVLNMTTPLTLTEIWDRQLGATADKLELPYSGGRSGRFPSGAETDKPAAQRPEERGSLGYTVDAPPGSGERAVGIEGERRGGTTRLIFTFRLGQRP